MWLPASGPEWQILGDISLWQARQPGGDQDALSRGEESTEFSEGEEMTRDEWQQRERKKNLKSFIELGKRIAAGELQIMDIQMDESREFGYSRVILFVTDGEKQEREQ